MNRRTRGILCTLSGGILWGFSGACGQYLFTNYHLNTSWLTVARMLGSGIILIIVCLLKQRERERCMNMWKDRSSAIQLVAFAIFGLMFCQYSYLTAISYSNAGTATVLQYLGPVLIMILVCVRNRQLPDLREAIAIVMAVFGTFLLATHGNPSSMVLSEKGLLWGLLAAGTLASYTLLPCRIIPRWGSMAVTGFGMFIGGLVLALTVRVWTIPVTLDGKGLVAVGGVVIAGTLFAYTLYLQGVADIGAVKASMLASIEPVAATVFSVLWLHSSFELIDLAGFLCIMTTVFLLARRKEQAAGKSETATENQEEKRKWQF